MDRVSIASPFSLLTQVPTNAVVHLFLAEKFAAMVIEFLLIVTKVETYVY